VFVAVGFFEILRLLDEKNSPKTKMRQQIFRTKIFKHFENLFKKKILSYFFSKLRIFSQEIEFLSFYKKN
jgi:hypothetical protein